MSGPKAADVQLRLDRALESIQRQVDAAAENASEFRDLGVAATRSSQMEALRVQSAVTPSATASEHAAEEVARLAGMRDEVDSRVAAAEQHLARAEEQRQQADQLREEANSQLEQAQAICRQVVSNVGNAGFLKHLAGFDDEYAQAQAARRMADDALKKEYEAARFLQAATDTMKLARNAFDAASTAGRQVEAEAQRIETLASARQSAAEIAAEGERLATSAHDEVQSLCGRIEGLNHDKFAAGQYAPLLETANTLRQAFEAQDFDRVNSLSADCVTGLRELAQSVANAQSAWEEASQAATNDMEAAALEWDGMDLQFLSDWSGDRAAVEQAAADRDAARAAFDEERFGDAQQHCQAALSAFRSCQAKAQTHKASSEQREQIADAIMNALYEQGYDAPTFYLDDADNSGGEDVLSDLTIFAKSPGSHGDMRMKVNLDGHVDFEIEAIGEGEEHSCVSLIRELQERLSGEVEFEMTDWGRAEHAQEEARVQINTQQQVREQTKERRRD